MDLALALALAAGIATAVLLVLAIGALRRKVRLVRQLTFALHVAALAVGFKVFTLLPGGLQFDLSAALTWVLVFALAIALVQVVGVYFFDVYLHVQQGVRLPPLLPRVIRGLAYLVVGLVILRLGWPNLDLGPIVATSAVTSLVLGLALQPILGNFFSGLVISLEKPFRINDWIRYNDVEGRVVDITWRTTRLRNRDNDDLVIPNSKIADQEVVNYFYPHPLHMQRIYVGVHYRTPPYRVKQALLAAVENVQGVLEKPSPAVFLHSFDDSAITYELRVWIEDVAHQPRISSHVRSEIWEKFRRREITIPFPIRTLEIEPRANRFEIARPPRHAHHETDGEASLAYPARLFVARGPDYGKSVPLDGSPVIIGRSANCRLPLREPRSSKEHVRIEWREDEGYVLLDLDSSNGTLINGDRVKEQTLRGFDRIKIGETVVVFETHAH